LKTKAKIASQGYTSRDAVLASFWPSTAKLMIPHGSIADSAR